MKQCKTCKKEIDDSEFITSMGKPSVRCIKCRSQRNGQAHRFYHKWHDEHIKDGRKYYHEHRERYKIMRHENRLKNLYGITLKEYNSMIAKQDNKCGICSTPFETDKNSKKGWGGKKEPVVDHDHVNGKVRGILCRGCNLSLSMIENKVFRDNANKYLSKLEKC